MFTFWQDLKIGARRLLRAPGFAAVAIAVLALGIGVNSAVFSVVRTVLLQPLPVRDAGSLRTIQHRHIERGFINEPSMYADLLDWRKQLTSFERLSGTWGGPMNLSGEGAPERVMVGKADSEFLNLLGLQPQLGRWFQPEEDQPGAARVAVLSQQLWLSRFGGDRDLDHLKLVLEGEPYRVIGVLPPGYWFVGPKRDLYIPLAGRSARTPPVSVAMVYGRLKPEASEAQLQTELDAATSALNAIVPRHKGWRLTVAPLKNFVVADVRNSLWMLLGAVGLVLLVACANVAGLVLLRAARHRRDLAVRLALGAGGGRLARQFIAEATPLAFLGGVAGLALAALSLKLVLLLPLDRIPRLAETQLDWAVVGFTAALSLLTLLACSLLPAFSFARTNVEGVLRDATRSGTGGPRGQRTRDFLVAFECALAVLLSVGALLTASTFANLASVDPGFNTSGMLTASIELPRARYADASRFLSFQQRLGSELRATPGVEEAALTNSLPLGGNYMRGDFPVEGESYAKPGDVPILFHRSVDEGYFSALRIKVLRGRPITAEDRENAPPVVVLNETAAQRLFGRRDPLGARVRAEGKLRTVVGIVKDTQHMDVSDQREPEVLLSLAQNPSPFLSVAVRLDPARYPDPTAFAPALRSVTERVDPNQALWKVGRYDRMVAARLSPRWLNQVLLGSFAVLALLLAAIGLYGLLGYSVEQRTREIGLRIALGADSGSVLRMVVVRGMLVAALGAATGLAAAMYLTKTIQSVLFGISPTEPSIYAAAALALLTVAAAASYGPARRATRVDPAVALRAE